MTVFERSLPFTAATVAAVGIRLPRYTALAFEWRGVNVHADRD